MPPGDKRRNPRRAITYPAFIDLGDDAAPRECLLCDASKEGALISVIDPKSLPDEFTLALSVDGLARRRCRVMWRGRDQIGVSFVKAFNGPVRALDVSHEAAERPAPMPEADVLDLEEPAAEPPMAEAPPIAAEEPEAAPAADDSDMFDIDSLARA